MSSETHSLSRLKDELIRARDLAAAGKEHLENQEKRVARLRAEKIRGPPSERLLDIMRDTHQVSHVQLIEREVRKAAQLNQSK